MLGRTHLLTKLQRPHWTILIPWLKNQNEERRARGEGRKEEVKEKREKSGAWEGERSQTRKGNLG